ncbi:MAG: ribonuclease HIII [Rhizonema sp. PD37]|nr:ribonuclease HIII [Rhizonema sp. PD37]
MSEIAKAIIKYEDIRQLISNNEFIVSDYKEINYGLQFSIQRSDWSGIIRIYQNKQGKVKVDFSQLDESEDSRLIKSFSEEKFPFSNEVNSTLSHELTLPIIGSDESGKGDYFGPLVSASLYIDEKIVSQLTKLKVRDSKAISDKRIQEIAKDIRIICQDKFVIVEISAERYNQIYTKLENEKKSLNDLLAWAHAKAIEELLSKVECQTAIIDQFADEKLLLEKLQEQGKKLTVIQAHRAESHIAVAAASILARERFLNKLDNLGKQYHTKLPKGSSKAAVTVARQLIEENGKEILEKVAKLHFKTTNEVLS